MYAIVKFKEIEDAVAFDRIITTYTGWELKHLLNSNVEGCIRVIDFNNGTKDDKALYEYLRDLGAFEEVVLK